MSANVAAGDTLVFTSTERHHFMRVLVVNQTTDSSTTVDGEYTGVVSG